MTCYSKKEKNKKHFLKRAAENKELYIILLPTLLFYLIFMYVPMFGNIIAFQRFSIAKGFLGSKFVGLLNFKNFITDYSFWRLLRNTLLINVFDLIFSFPMPIIFALMLNELSSQKYKKVIQTVTYMPHFISTVIIASMILTFFSTEGIVNSIRVIFGGERLSFMTMPECFRAIFIGSGIWQNLGWDSIIYIAALSAIDMQLYEAASIDGAGRWKQLLHVTLPGIVPTIAILLIMRIGQMLTIGYEKIILMYNPSIYETADVISTYVYRRGLLEGDYSYSAAVGMFNSVINLILLVTSNRISKARLGSGLW